MADLFVCDNTDPQLSLLLRADRALARARRRMVRYHSTMIAQDVPQIVDLAGGWICDRVLTGWIVTILVADPTDPLPARILGADVVELAEASALPPGPPPQSLAIAALDGFEDGIPGWMLKNLVSGQQEINIWGDVPRSVANLKTEAAQHVPSVAARAFKARALAAAAIPGSARPVAERYRTAGTPKPAYVDVLERCHTPASELP